jgi:predicted phage-related endonuclease
MEYQNMDRLICNSASYESESEWLNLRKNLIGGSEIGIVANMDDAESEYTTPLIKLWMQKIGQWNRKETSLRMWLGKKMEPIIKELYEHYEQDFATTENNIAKGKRLREVVVPQEIFIHNTLPFIGGSLDGLVMVDGKLSHIVEFKEIGVFAKNKWKFGIPPKYMCQVQYYLGITGLPFGELVLLDREAENIEVVRFERDDAFIAMLFEKSKVFWNNYILPAREAIENKEVWEKFSPPVDGSRGYEEFLKERFVDEGGICYGSDEELDIIRKITTIDKIIDRKTNYQRELTNTLKTKIGNNAEMDFGILGRVEWKGINRLDKEGNRIRQFKIKLTDLFDLSKEEIEKLETI